ncbi:MAG: CDP-diacylglycerol--glycerol-3-phosphate 3-phosphatidyltransferase [Acidobacteriota bacterium]|nr:CDP-diacylglycerol--glycerol-3-phosphate 3-phosphatidyltransferase [Acidobacteriota bacterium]
MNLPNLLSLSRILLAPILVVVLLTEVEDKEFIALGIFLLAAFTDFLDGFIARRRSQVTRLGQLLDPAADKILTSAAFISLVGLGLAPAWMVVVIVAREFAVSALRSVAALQNRAISASVAGKLKTTVQIVAISLAIVSNQLGSFQQLAPASLWAALVITLYSGLEYFVKFGRVVVQEPT